MKLNTEDFLWQSYFGVTKTEAQKNCCLKKDVICLALDKCMDRAFSDFARTIDYTYSDSDLKKLQKDDPGKASDFLQKKEKFKCKQKKEILRGINEIIMGNPKASEEERKNYFDKVHEEICNNLCKTHDALKTNLTYGQAQKWLNMTLKYMVLMDLWEDDFKGSEKFFHIPLDNYIFKEMRENQEFKKNKDWINCIKKEGNDQYKVCYKKESDDEEEKGQYFLIEAPEKVYSKKGERKTAWSNIESYNLYFKIQKMLRDSVPISMSPLEWENKVWLDEAENKSLEKDSI